MTLNDFIIKYDPENQFNVLKDSWKQIDYVWQKIIELSELVNKKFNSVILTGLGGSAIAGDVFRNFLHDDLDFPFFVNRSYSLPIFADQNTLVIISSYSGYTEETLSVFNKALELKCYIICIGSGGKTEELSKKLNIPFIKLQEGFQPRFALYSSFFALLKVMQTLKLIKPQDEFVNRIKNLLKKRADEYSTNENYSVEIANSLIGFIPVIYSAVDLTSSIGLRFKCQLNENSKLNAFCNVIPEMNHNEIIGWETFSEKQFEAKVINILDDNYAQQIKKRFQVSTELLIKNGVEVINLKSDCSSFKERVFDLIYLCDWISYYLAIIRNQNPITIKNINLLKENLAKEYL